VNPEGVLPPVRAIRADEAFRLRAFRLGALAEAPSAFGSTLAREEAFPDGVWRERAVQGAAGGDSVTYVAEEADRWLGMATGLVEDPDGAGLELVGMFVEPAARGRGVGSALVEAIAVWARGRRAARLRLWVTSTNHTAIRLYHRCGFRPTGREKPLEHIPFLSVLEMVRDL
jgi:GNAT superfamily N-acetyltransferase